MERFLSNFIRFWFGLIIFFVFIDITSSFYFQGFGEGIRYTLRVYNPWNFMLWISLMIALCPVFICYYFRNKIRDKRFTAEWKKGNKP